MPRTAKQLAWPLVIMHNRDQNRGGGDLICAYCASLVTFLPELAPPMIPKCECLVRTWRGRERMREM